MSLTAEYKTLERKLDRIIDLLRKGEAITAPKNLRRKVNASRVMSELGIDAEALRSIRRMYPNLMEERRDENNKGTGKYVYYIDEIKLIA